MSSRDIGKIFIRSHESVRNVLAIMAKNKFVPVPAGIVLIVDEKSKLLGIATDGDIRRGLSEGVSLDDPIEKVMNKNPFLIEGPKSPNEILSIIASKIKQEYWHKDRLSKIIIVDKNKRVMDLVSFYDLWQKSDVRFK